ncbi:MAG TPA: proton-conducting transporter membrane subunit, partial [Paracoccaceae bacterium]|nr:proton-conducting transporter membrane subunit [Paracoccaceae bacterium]
MTFAAIRAEMPGTLRLSLPIVPAVSVHLAPVVIALSLVAVVYIGLVALVQTDYKKVLAYSTVSQLGFMMLGLGVGGWAAGLFHLLTHAFFKAMLFLGA